MSQNPLHSYETHRLVQISLLIAIKAVICDGYRNRSETYVLLSQDSKLLQNFLTVEHSALLTNFYGCLRL